MKPGRHRARAPVTDWTGQTLYGKWTVQRVIGVGGTSTVLEARHRNGRLAALKILHPHLAAHGHTRERFLREGRLANLVNHPGVVAVLDDFMTDDGTAILVLELVDGQTLARLAKESGGFLEPREVVAAACAVLEILAVAHDANVIHRDIKPENVLRCANGAFKLADFGLAALCHELGMLTGTNTALGTPAYMSPEQARGEMRQIDARTDIWGLGATMFTLLTGHYLHARSASKNLVVAAATEAIPAILSLDPGMHPGLAALIERAVRMDKEDRWPNARVMLAELRAIDLPISEIRRAYSPSLDRAAMPTAPSSFLSRNHAGSRNRRAELRSKKRLILELFGFGAAAVVAVLVWLLTGAPAKVDEAASGVEPPVTASETSASVARLASPPERPVSPEREAAKEAPLTEPRSARRALGAKARARPTSTPGPSPSSPPRASGAASDTDFSVPDDVLDRRE